MKNCMVDICFIYLLWFFFVVELFNEIVKFMLLVDVFLEGIDRKKKEFNVDK